MFIAGEAGLPLNILFVGKRSSYNNDYLLFSHARGGTECFLDLCACPKKKTVMVPKYICHDFVRAIQSKYQLKYYDTDDNFKPAFDSLNRELGNDILAVVIVHYFGFITSVPDSFVKHCKDLGVLLIDDCAHVLFSRDIAENLKGDASVYSLKKLLPVSDGGLLYLKSNFNNGGTYNYDKTKKYKGGAAKNTFKFVIKHYMQKSGLAIRRGYHEINDEHIDRSYSGVRMISALSKSIFEKIEGCEYKDFIKRKRRENFISFVSLFGNVQTKRAFELPFMSMMDRDVPYYLPVRLRFDTCGIVAKLRSRGVPAITWPRLDHSISCYAEAERCRRKMMFLPLHENLSKRHIEFIFNEVCKSI